MVKLNSRGLKTPRLMKPSFIWRTRLKLTESSAALAVTSGAVSKLAIPVGIPETFC